MEKLYKDIPTTYPLCLHADCPKADTCLRQLAYRQHAELPLYVRLLNPARCTKQAGCPHYADSKPVIFAKGFTNFQKKMFPDQYSKFMSILICHFGRNAYFMRRRGATPLPPKEQEIIKKALKRSGITQAMEFDQYVEGINWEP
ncbi:MAG: hypothetical protein IJ013_08085 [Bacteroidaceae bacterium]|nr:hypothetical protein [Bacteroidaceae bacterium]